MDHPLREADQKELRQRVAQLLKNAYSAHRASNIVFVCGGNNADHMRMLFREYCAEKLPEFEVFFPEYAMEKSMLFDGDEQFDLAEFEELIADISHAIVIFPEAAGSYAETGYFSAIEKVAKRSILVLDTRFKKDSFITLGPAKKISEKTVFHPLVQIDYGQPDFESISEKIKRLNTRKYRKQLKFERYNDLTSYETCCVIHEIVDLLTIATISDIQYVFRLLFGGTRYSEPRVRRLTSILLGAKYFREVGVYGHLSVNSEKRNLLEIRDGHIEEERSIRLSLADLYQDEKSEFVSLINGARDAD